MGLGLYALRFGGVWGFVPQTFKLLGWLDVGIAEYKHVASATFKYSSSGKQKIDSRSNQVELSRGSGLPHI